MNGYREFSLRRFLPFLLVLLMPVAAVILGYLQWTWIDKAALIEEDRFRRSVWTDVFQALGEIYDDLRILGNAVVSPDGQDVSSDTVGLGVKFWLNQTRIPEAVDGIWLIRDGDPAVHLSIENGGITSETPDLPEELEPLQDLSGSYSDDSGPPDDAEVRRVIVRLARSGFVVMPVDPATIRPRILVIDFDFESLFAESLPVFLEDEFQDVPFRIVRTNPRRIVYATAGIGDLEHPQIVVPLTRMLSALNILAEDSGRIDEAPAVRTRGYRSPVVSLLAIPNLRDPREMVPLKPPDHREGGDYMSDNWGMLQVFYPEGEIMATIGSWRRSNIILSAGLLLLLLASSLVIFRLYRRAGNLRTREQEFVASMSHELRLPVSVIRAMSENLAAGIVLRPERVMQYGQELHAVVVRLAGMVEGILMYAGLQSGNRHGNPTTIDVATFLSSIIGPMKELAVAKGIEFKIELGRLPTRIIADEAAIRIIIENLLSNAFHHGTEEGGAVRLMVRRIPFDKLLVVVEDDGPGIPAKEQRRVFLAFYRGGRSVREQIPGSGLGLNLVRRVAAILGGSAKIESPYDDAAGNLHSGCRATAEIPFVEGVEEAKEDG